MRRAGGSEEDAIAETSAWTKRVEVLCEEGMEWHVPTSTIVVRRSS